MDDVVALLDQPLYGYAEADQLLRLTPGTAKRWIDGYERGGRSYAPVIREERTNSAWVTWGEFTETRLLAEFRRSVPMIKLRPVVQWLRNHFQREYPLAYAYPFLRREGQEVLLSVQQELELDHDLWMAVPSGQGVLLTPSARRFTSATNYLDGTGPAESAVADPGTPHVLLHPARRQGQPTVEGIRAATLAELVNAGEPVGFVAATYDLPAEQVEEAVSYESARLLAA